MEYFQLDQADAQPASQLKFSFNGNTLHSPRRNMQRHGRSCLCFVPRHRARWASRGTLTAPAFLIIAVIIAVAMNVASYCTRQSRDSLGACRACKPEQYPTLHRVVEIYASQPACPNQNSILLTIPPNAFATGRNPSMRTGVTSGLLNMMTKMSFRA